MTRPFDSSDDLWADAFGEHQAFLTRLARSLTHDPDVAADVVQDTLLVAYERGRAPTGSVRSFLAGVLRNRAFKARRGEDRRRHHEHRAARPESFERTDDIGTQLEAQRHMLEALERLADPYRATLVLRYQREMTPTAIAAEHGVPLATVKSRLKRGLEKLREDLDRRYGDRRVWSAATLGLGRPELAPLVPLVPGGAVLATKWMVGVAVGVVLATVLWNLRDPEGPARAEAALGDETEVASGAGLAVEPATKDELEITGNETRETVGPVDAVEDVETAEAPVGARGNVYDLDGAAVAGVSLVYRPNFGEKVELESDSRGAFEIPGPVSRGSVFALQPDLWNLCAGALEEPPDVGHPTVVVAPRATASFEVVDVRGAPVAQATVYFILPTGWDSALPVAPDMARRPNVTRHTDENGRFDQELPLVPGASVEVNGGPRLVPNRVELGPLLVPGTTIVLEDRPIPDYVLQGRVVDVDDEPVPGVDLNLGPRWAGSGADGNFEFRGTELEAGLTLKAAKPGYLPVFIEDPAGRGSDVHGWDETVTIRLERGALRIAGRVVDQEGKPLELAAVTLADQTHWGTIRGALTSAEDALDGDGDHTNAEGRFELAGLLDREYEVVVIEYSRLWSRRIEGVRPGTHDLRVVLGPPAGARSLTGRCVSPDGMPVAGVAVAPRLVLEQHLVGGPPGPAAEHGYVGTKSTTDEDGRFELYDVPVEVTSLSIQSSSILPRSRPLEASETEVEIVVERRAAFELEVTGEHAAATGYRLLDENGDALVIYDFNAHGHSSSAQDALEDGKSGIRTVSERAVELVLYKRGEVVHSSPVTIAVDGVTRLRVR